MGHCRTPRQGVDIKISRNLMEVVVPAPISKVRLLPQEVIHRIAAGEVVDRPLSVLKEFLENAIDAGASKVKIVLVDGGAQLVEVEDNGCGMSKGDLEIAVQRHATSKVRSMEDLDEIHSLGFRGEALSAIASVTRLEIDSAQSQSDGSVEAWTLEVVGGVKRPLKASSRRIGTRVRAHDLFFNIPARRKFLKKSSSEAADALALLESFAMIHPNIAFEWHVIDHSGELKAQHNLPQETLKARYQTLCPKEGEFFQLQKDNPFPGVLSLEVVGLKAPACSAFQKSVVLSVNNRLVIDKRLPFSMREAFQGLISIGAYPFVYVRVEVEPSLIDVNIHPQKKEIRWPSGFSLAGIAYSLVRPLFQPKDLEAREAEPLQQSLSAGSQFPDSLILAPLMSTTANSPSPLDNFLELNSLLPKSSPTKSFQESHPEFKFSSLRVVGELGAAWIVCEHPSGMILIDQHAAHERVNFEKIMCESEKTGSELLRSRPLLLPLKLRLPLGIEADSAGLQDVLESLGFEIGDPFGATDFIEFVAVPETDRKINWSEVLEQIFHDLQNDDDPRSIVESLKVKLAASLSCHGSVRRGQRLSHEQIVALLGQMDEVQWGGLCPHGRPLWFLLSHGSIEETFHR